MESPHDVLGVDPDASEAEIERAYRRRVKETHPDQGGSISEFLRVRSAYEQLVDGDGESTVDVAGPGDAERAAGRRRNGRHGPEASGVDDSEDGTEEARETGETTVVEYLDYDVLADYDWDLADDDLFEQAADADLDPPEFGRFVVEGDETLLQAAERHGHDWPYSCRGGACANCAVAVLEGELSVPVNHILPEEMIGRDIRLSCIGEPLSDRLRVVFDVKHLPELDELRLPPHPASD